ncbi:DNA ligase [uncultured archaeon]|nr:DNA ligase [uncultured archaeon]
MKFAELTKLFDSLSATTKRLEMTKIIAEFLATVPEKDISDVMLLLKGRLFPEWDDRELGVAEKIMVKAIADTSGLTESKVDDLIRETGDVGIAAAKALSKKTQTTLFTKELTVEYLLETLRKFPSLQGKGSQDRKLTSLKDLLSSASGEDGKYVARLTVGELRLGVGEGILRDAVSQAYGINPDLVEHALNLTCDIGYVASLAKKGGTEALEKVTLVPGKPMKVMLAQKASGIEGALEELKGTAAFEVKYDGARIQIHKQGDSITLFTRRLEDVTKQFPEVVAASKTQIKAKTAIVEGEMVAISDTTVRRPRPFQDLSRRIKRKYDVEKIQKEIPVEVNLFDALLLDHKILLTTPFIERRKTLASIIEETPDFRLAQQLITSDAKQADEFYKKSLALGHEGVMAKNLTANYVPGSRVGNMYKVKPIMETLDLVITGATWGEGRRASWLGSFLLSAYDIEEGMFKTMGRMATGITDEQLQEITDILKPTIRRQEGKECVLEPTTVVEVAFEEIQKSPTYESGYALRFPRLVRIRADRGPQEADTLKRIEEMVKG